MSQLDPINTTIGDLVNAALVESGAIGQGQQASGQDITDAWARAQWMLQQWNQMRYVGAYHLVTVIIPSTGAPTYPIGFDFNGDFGSDFSGGYSAQGWSGNPSSRPDKIEAAFVRQLQTNTQYGPVDYPLELIHSMEDWSRISLKGLVSFPGFAFYDPTLPYGTLYPWPIPQANLYSIGVVIKDQLPIVFKTLATKVTLPPAYYAAIVFNLGMRLRQKYRIPTFPGDQLPALAKNSLAVIRGGNTAIARLLTPSVLNRPSLYNIYNDRVY